MREAADVGRPPTAEQCRQLFAGPTGAAPVMCFRRRGHAGSHTAGATQWPARDPRPASGEIRGRAYFSPRADLHARFEAVVARERERWAEHLERLRPRRRPRFTSSPPARRI
jgi:hypothetical protein